ncbi:MAG: lasso peptide biosynthesis B2 protein [Pseudonocardiaceae bacterium]
MSAPIALAPPCALSAGERSVGLFAVTVASLLLMFTRARPNRLRRVLCLLEHGSIEAHPQRAERAWDIVTTVSLRCASGHGCLRRSLAVIVLCRLSGARVSWRVGFRSPPPQIHAWVEVGGAPIRETVDPRMIYTAIITV